MKIKLLKESDNTTMKKDVNGVVPIVYADAVNQADEKKKIIADRLKDKKPELKKPFTGTTKQPLPKKEEQAKSELSEALFEDYEGDSLNESSVSVSQIADFIEDAVEGLRVSGTGCNTYKLDNRLAICVGWLDGYDADDETVIHDNAEPTWAINAGIKVWTSDDLRTDYEFINAPYYEDGDVWDTDNSISPNEDYTALANYFLKEYQAMKNLSIEKDGKINANAEEDDLDEDLDKSSATQISELSGKIAGSLEDLIELLTEVNSSDYVTDTYVAEFTETIDTLNDLAYDFAHINGSLTESPTATLEKPKKVKDIEELPDDVYTLVYDRLFPGNRKHRPLLAQGLPEMYGEEKFYTKGLGDSDIGVSVKDEADAELAKTVAKELKLKYELKKSNYLRGGNQYIAIIHIPDDISEMTVADYYKKIGKSTDRDDVRMSPDLWNRQHKKGKYAEPTTEKMDEDLKIIAELGDYKPWSGAVSTYETIDDAGKLDELEGILEDLYPEGIGMTELNDLLWFESDWVLEQLGLNEEDEDEDEDDDDEGDTDSYDALES